MSELRLLSSDDADEFERMLLSAAATEAPSAAARERTLAAVAAVAAGAAAPTSAANGPATTTTTTSAALGERGPAGENLTAAPASGSRAFSVMKWIGLAVVVAGLLGLALRATTTSQPASVASVEKQSDPAPLLPPPAIASTTAMGAPVEVPSAQVEAQPATSAVAAVSVRRPALPPPAPSENTEASLADEVAALDVARKAVLAGDPNGAITALDAHDVRFPRGALADEALVLRVESLVKRGDGVGARALAEPFLKRNPRGTYANRVHTLLGDAAPR